MHRDPASRIVKILCLALALCVLAGIGAEPSAHLRFSIELAGAADTSGLPPTAALRLRARENTARPEIAVPLTEALSPIDIPARVGWDVSVEAPGFWAPGQVLGPYAAGSDTTEVLRLWPAGTVEGRLTYAEPKAGPTKALALRLSVPPAEVVRARSFPRQAESMCELGKEGTFRCPAPAGAFDLALYAQGFVPAYRWGATIRRGEALPFGAVKLRKGSSVAGYVTVEGGPLDPARCIARLAPAAAPGNPSVTGDRIRSSRVEAMVSAAGFFQFAGVAPGTYMLEVEQPGFGPVSFGPVAVWPEAETFLRSAVLLTPQLTLEPRLSPPLDWLGKPWQVQIWRHLGNGGLGNRPIFDGPAGEDGGVRLPQQAAGHFEIRARDAVGGILLAEDFEVRGPGDLAPIFEVPQTPVEGTVTLGGEPVAARIFWGGRFGRTKVEMLAGEDGAYEGVLGRAGRWPVTLEIPGRKGESQVWVEVAVGPSGVAEVDLEVPNGRIFGRVVSAEPSLPLRQAHVELGARPPIFVETRVEADGRFEILGVPEGLVAIAAGLSHGGVQYSSPGQVLRMETDGEVGPVELRLLPGKKVAGVVLGPRGPIAGANLEIHPFPYGFGDTVQSDWEGRFEAEIGGLWPEAEVVVKAAGHAFKTFRVPIDSSPWAFNIPAEGGTLTFTQPTAEDYQAKAASGRELIYRQGLVQLSYNDLFHWQRGHGILTRNQRDVTLPEMAPGEYSICWEQDGFSAFLGLAGAPPVCDRGTLSAGGVLHLTAPR